MDPKHLKNGKYFHGRYTDFEERRGWFVGSFFEDNHPSKTDQIEVMFKHHQTGDRQVAHYHQQKIELLIFLEGKARYNINGEDVILTGGDFLFVDVNNIISGEFLAPSTIFALHSPSLPADKVVVDSG